VRLLIAFVGSVVLIGAGGLAFVAGGHRPTGADASPAIYRWLRGGGITSIVLGVLLMVLALSAAANYNS
jgi:hypothetical protein